MGDTRPGRSRRTEIVPTIRALCSFRDTRRSAVKYDYLRAGSLQIPLMFGPRLVSAALLILLLAGLVGATFITRYRYYDTQGVLFHRIDRWTGRVEQWDCRVFKTDENGKVLGEWTDTDEPAPPSGFKPVSNPFVNKKTVCGWDASQ